MKKKLIDYFPELLTEGKNWTEKEKSELAKYLHAARTMAGSSPYKQNLWASKEYAKKHPEVSSTAAYKELERWGRWRHEGVNEANEQHAPAEKMHPVYRDLMLRRIGQVGELEYKGKMYTADVSSDRNSLELVSTQTGQRSKIPVDSIKSYAFFRGHSKHHPRSFVRLFMV